MSDRVRTRVDELTAATLRRCKAAHNSGAGQGTACGVCIQETLAAALAAATPGEPLMCFCCRGGCTSGCECHDHVNPDAEEPRPTPTPETVERVARVIYVYAEAGWPDEWETLPERTRMRLLGAASAALRARGEGAE